MPPPAAPPFDPYHKWLGIREGGSLPNHYRLLGLELWESDPEVIRDAAMRQINHVRTFRAGPHRNLCIQVLEQLQEARDTLLDPRLRSFYDRQLKMLEAAAAPQGTLADGSGSANHPAPHPPMRGIIECAECGAENSASRRFCSSCGARLWEPCIECGVPSGPGELHCGGCGVNLAQAAQQHIDQIESRLLEADRLRSQYQHDQAIELLETCITRDHAKLASLRRRAEEMIEQLRTEAEQLERLRHDALGDARRQAEQHDYERAALTLEQVPEPLRTRPMQKLLDEVRQVQLDVLSLAAEIRHAVDEKKWDGLLKKVERLLEMKPDHAQALELAAMLRPREAKRTEARRNKLLQAAALEAKTHNYARAVKLLEQLPADQRTPEMEKLLNDVTRRADEAAWLFADLREAVVYDEHLLPIAERLLKLRPEDRSVPKLIAVLKQRAKLSPADRAKIKTGWPAPPAKSAWGYPIEVVRGFTRIGNQCSRHTPCAVAVQEGSGTQRVPGVQGSEQDAGQFAVAAGLALQCLQKAVLGTNLAPREKGGVFGLLKGRRQSARSAWGIDVGRCALKAVRLAIVPAEDRVVAEAAECIEYGNVLTQPNVNAAETVAAALKTLRSRHELKECAIGVGLPGQKILTRLFTLPLGDKKKIAELMHYEVQQQIPLPIDTVQWDYQALESGETPPEPDMIGEYPIALFAIKTEEIAAHLQPFVEQGIKADVVQSDCAALFNFLAYERFPVALSPQEEALGRVGVLAMLDIGAEASNIVVTGGHTLWMRNIPIGGNTFTRALAKHYNLTWQQAEKLKRNPLAAPSLHRSYQALQPPLADLTAEVQRSVDQYLTQDRRHAVQRLLVTGGGLKLHGLLKYLWLGR